MDKTLAQRRKLSNIDIKFVAEKSGLSSAQIIAIESNNLKAFSSKLVFQMNVLLPIPASYIVSNLILFQT